MQHEKAWAEYDQEKISVSELLASGSRLPERSFASGMTNGHFADSCDS